MFIKKNKVSVLICTYNAEKFIKKTLKNLFQQEYKNYEVLIFDDKSTDNTLQILKKFKNKINIFHNIKRGPYGGLNYLLKYCKGDYIAIQDHDDLWMKEKLKEQVDFLTNNNYLAVGSNILYYYEKFDKFVPNTRCSEPNSVPHTTLMFRNNGFKYNTNYDFADEHFQKKILFKKGKIKCLNKFLAIRRMRFDNNNLSIQRTKLNFKKTKELLYLNYNNPKYLISILKNNIFPKKKMDNKGIRVDKYLEKFL